MAKKQSEFRRLKLAMAIAICLPFSTQASEQHSSLSKDSAVDSLPLLMTQEEYAHQSQLKPQVVEKMASDPLPLLMTRKEDVQQSNLKPPVPERGKPAKDSRQSVVNSQSPVVATRASNGSAAGVTTTASSNSQSQKLYQPGPIYDKARLKTSNSQSSSNNVVDNAYAGNGDTRLVSSQPTQAVNSQAGNRQSGDATQGQPLLKMVDRNDLRADAYIKNEMSTDGKQPGQKSGGDDFQQPLQPEPIYNKVRSNSENSQRASNDFYTVKGDASSHVFLRKMVAMALMHSPEVRSSDAEVLAAGYYVDQTKGQRWPQVQVGVSTPLATQGGSADLQRNNSNANDTSGSVSVVTPIYDWGKISHQVDSAEEGVTAAVNARSYTKEMLAYNTVSELINLGRYQESRQVAVAYMMRMKQLADMLEQITAVDQGRASEFTQAKAKLLSARANLDDIEHQLSLSRIKLVRLLGIEPNLPENISWQDSMIPASTAIASLAKNPNLLKLQAQTKAAESEADSIKAAGLPQLNLVVSKNTAKDINGNETGWYTGVNVQWNAFSGGSQKAAQMAALAKATGAQQQYETAYRDLEYQINNLVQTRDSSFIRARDFDRLSIETDRVRQMFYDQWYNLGKRTLLDVLTAENDHFNNQLSAINNRYDAYVANINVIASAAMLLSWLER